MEAEVEGRVKPLGFKVRGVSRESVAQKAINVLDSDLRTHWSSSTNTKEWLLLELEDSCLLSHIRIHNKSVLEWEISVGLRFKPDTFMKVRPRCEAPRRDITYQLGYQACRFVRISCLRGNPIAIFFIQLMGISVANLEPELQPVVDYVLPHIVSHIRDPYDIYLQLLQDIATRLSPLLPQLEGELAVPSDAIESSMRFFVMLVGPFHPILTVLSGRDIVKVVTTGTDSDVLKISQAAVFTVSSNFQAPPKRIRSPGPISQPSGHALALHADAAVMLLRAAHKDNHLGSVCRKVARILRKLRALSSAESIHQVREMTASTGGLSVSGHDEVGVPPEAVVAPSLPADYSSIFGDEFRVLDNDGLEIGRAGIIDVAAVEEGLLHVLYACSSQPVMCRRLADPKSDIVPVLPFVQAILPALRPPSSTATEGDQVDETFWQWQAGIVQRALSQVVVLSTSPSYRPLLDACAGYLSSYSPTHVKGACMLIDLCTGPLAPWLPMVVAKVDLAIELLEDLLGIIQAGHRAPSSARAALVYLMLALSGHIDDILAEYKDVRYNLLFIIEMLEPFLIPAITPVKSTIAFGDVSAVLLEKQEQNCALALDLLRMASKKPAVLPVMEGSWRCGHVAPSVLLSILAPHLLLPAGIDLHSSTMDKGSGLEHALVVGSSAANRNEISGKPALNEDEYPQKQDMPSDMGIKNEVNDQAKLLFAPIELKSVILPRIPNQFEGTSTDNQRAVNFGVKVDARPVESKSVSNGTLLSLTVANAEEYFNLQTEYLQLVNTHERELRSLEFIRFGVELHSRSDSSKESHDAAIDALLLAAECHLNPFFMIPSSEFSELVSEAIVTRETHSTSKNDYLTKKLPSKGRSELEVVGWLEEERDKAVLHILMQAADWDSKSSMSHSDEKFLPQDYTGYQDAVEGSGGIQVCNEDKQVEDAVTLVREHQALLCTFFIRQLQKERQNMYEVLLQGLLFILDSATRLFTPADCIIDVILQCAERLNTSLLSYYHQVKEGRIHAEPGLIYGIRRQWGFLRRLVLAASGGRPPKEDVDSAIPKISLMEKDLIPASVWMVRISHFSSSSSPLVRYVGWMVLSRYAKRYQETGLTFLSNLQQLTRLLLIFSDELAYVKGWQNTKINEDNILMEAACRAFSKAGQEVDSLGYANHLQQLDAGGLVKAIYPELDLVFPDLRMQFSQFSQVILEAIGQQLKSFPSTAVPDLLSWFAETCSNPFPSLSGEREQAVNSQSPSGLKGYVRSHLRFVIMYLLEVIVVEHMETIVPELPRVLDLVLSLCYSSYCDVPLLESVLAVLKPIISHATATAIATEGQSSKQVPGTSFETLCFGAMIEHLKAGPDADLDSRGPRSALLLFLAGSFLSDLSVASRIELLNLFQGWVNFTKTNSTNLFYNYLQAFQKILAECCSLLKMLSEEKLAFHKFSTEALFALTVPSSPRLLQTEIITQPTGLETGVDFDGSESDQTTTEDGRAYLIAETPDETAISVGLNEQQDNGQVGRSKITTSPKVNDKAIYFGSSANIEEFEHKTQDLMLALGPAIEACWKLHPQLALKIAQLATKCLYYSGFRSPAKQGLLKQSDQASSMSDLAVEHLADRILTLQKGHCWQVASVAMEFLISFPLAFSGQNSLHSICAALQYQSSHAPRIAWRLKTSSWLIKALTAAGKDAVSVSATSVLELLCSMLEHYEPEQRLAALQQLGKLIKDELDGHRILDPSLLGLQDGGILFEDLRKKSFVQMLVSYTWEKVASAAVCDPSFGLRKEAMELLLNYIPFAEPMQLQSLLRSSDSILTALSVSLPTINSGPLQRLALMVLGRACLYSQPSDIIGIPVRVWSSLQLMAETKAGGVFFEAERAVCQALLQLRDHGEVAKKSIREALSSTREKMPPSMALAPVREAVLEVLARLSAASSNFDSDSTASVQFQTELKEAEIELELVVQERMAHSTAGNERPHVDSESLIALSGSSPVDTRECLKHLKSLILDEERSMAREAIAIRRERQRIAQRDRQLRLEQAALKEIELLQELDRERSAEIEREIERQRAIENERAKTREMRHTMELEAEKRAQREFQRETEQRDASGVRASRREFSSSATPSTSRARERYRERERESVRAPQEGGSRGTGGSTAVRESTTTPPATPKAGGAAVPASAASATLHMTSTAVTSATTTLSSRTYSGQSIGYSQSRERSDDRGYEDNVDGNGSSRDMVEGIGLGDAETGSGIDSGNSGSITTSSQRAGQRTSRPRQIVERRERDGRREGKWERKQT